MVNGVHLWNFDRIDESAVLWSCDTFYNLTEIFSQETRISLKVSNDWIEVKMQKTV